MGNCKCIHEVVSNNVQDLSKLEDNNIKNENISFKEIRNEINDSGNENNSKKIRYKKFLRINSNENENKEVNIEQVLDHTNEIGNNLELNASNISIIPKDLLTSKNEEESFNEDSSLYQRSKLKIKRVATEIVNLNLSYINSLEENKLLSHKRTEQINQKEKSCKSKDSKNSNTKSSMKMMNESSLLNSSTCTHGLIKVNKKRRDTSRASNKFLIGKVQTSSNERRIQTPKNNFNINLVKKLEQVNNNKHKNNDIFYDSFLTNNCVASAINTNFDKNKFNNFSTYKNNFNKLNTSNKLNLSNMPTEYQTLEISQNEEEIYLNNIKKNAVFINFTENIFNALLDLSKGIELEKDIVFVKEGSIGKRCFIIKEGKVELSSKNNKDKKQILGVGDYFGELTLVKSHEVVKYTAKTLCNTKLLTIKGKYYRNIIKKLNKSPMEHLIDIINRIIFFKGFDQCLLFKICFKITTIKYSINDIIMDNNNNNFFCYFCKGVALLTNKDNSTLVLRENMIIGQVELLLDCKEQMFKEVKATAECECLILTRDILNDVLGKDYKKIILLNTFTNAINNNNFFKNILKDKSIQENVFKLFKSNHYNDGDIVFEIDRKKNKKVILILIGSLCSKGKNYFSSTIKTGEIYGDFIINSTEDLVEPITAKGSLSVLETSWQKILDYIYKNKRGSCYDILKISNVLSNNEVFRNLSENQLLDWGSQFSEKIKYKKDDILVNYDSIVDFFYLITKGNILLEYNDLYSKEIEEGNYFGEESIIYNKKSKFCAKCLNEVQIIKLEKNKFLQLLDKYENIKNEITEKINYRKIKLLELYSVQCFKDNDFSGLQLVHNKNYLYVAKSIDLITGNSSSKEIANYKMNEKNILQKLNHPFIISFIRTFKLNKVYYILLEFINGKNLEDYILKKSKDKLKNKTDIIFYGASLMLVLSYLNKKMLIHRDINPKNILITSKGYIKLIDFSKSKMIKDLTYSIIGTPIYMAPEVITGKGYTFTCDYWSIGICLYYVYYGYLPFDNSYNDIMALYKQILQNKIQFPDDDSPQSKLVNDFLKKLLCKDPTIRLCSLNYVMKNELLFENFPWDKLQTMELNDKYIPCKKYKYNEREISNFLLNYNYQYVSKNNI